MAIDHGDLRVLLPSALLARAQFVVDHDHIAFELLGLLDEFGCLALAHQEARADVTHHGALGGHHGDAQRLHQLA
jgi:hypothetical protein